VWRYARENRPFGAGERHFSISSIRSKRVAKMHEQVAKESRLSRAA
jgi:hypothetical protein